MKPKFKVPPPLPLEVAPPELDPDTVYIFTDGSFRYAGKTNYGGWAAVLIKGEKYKEISGAEKDTTTNRMELTAIFEGILALNLRDVSRVAIYSDSAYAVNCVTTWGPAWAKRGWVGRDGNEVLNRDLIEAILMVFLPRMRIGWVKGHSSHKYNDRADFLAKKARNEEQQRSESERAPPATPNLDEVIYGADLANVIRLSKDKQQDMMRREAAERLGARLPRPRNRVRRA